MLRLGCYIRSSLSIQKGRRMKHARDDYNRIQDPANLIPKDEPVFIIRGQDRVGPATVRYWASKAEDAGADQSIIEAARWQAKQMESWQLEHGSKIPDLAEK